MISLPKYTKNQLIQELLGGTQMDRKTDVISLTFLFKNSRLKIKTETSTYKGLQQNNYPQDCNSKGAERLRVQNNVCALNPKNIKKKGLKKL